MKEKILTIINDIRLSKDLPALESISEESSLRDDLGLTSFDLAELTVHIEDGLISTVGEIYTKLDKE